MAKEPTIKQLEEAFVADASKTTHGSVNLAQLRKEAVDAAVISCTSPGGKPSHVGYVAGDLYRFLLTGEKPKGPQNSSGS